MDCSTGESQKAAAAQAVTSFSRSYQRVEQELFAQTLISSIIKTEIKKKNAELLPIMRAQMRDHPSVTCTTFDPKTKSTQKQKKTKKYSIDFTERRSQKAATQRRKTQQDAKTAINDITRSLFQTKSEEEKYQQPSTTIDMSALEEEIFSQPPSFVSEVPEDTPVGIWAHLVNFFNKIKQKGSDYASAISASMADLPNIFSKLSASITTLLSTGVKVTSFLASQDWQFIVKILILLTIYTLGYVLDLFPIATIIASLYGFYAFTTPQEKLVPALIAAAALWSPPNVRAVSSPVVVNVKYQSPTEVIPGALLGGAAMMAAACMGQFTFFQDPKSYDSFITRLDKQSKAWSAMTSLTEKITGLVHKGMCWIGLEKYGFAEDLSQALPPDVEKYVEEVKHFSDGNNLSLLASSRIECERAQELFMSLGQLQMKYRAIKPINDVVNRFAGFVYKVFNLANISNPKYQKPRDETVCVFLKGDPGVGKTKLIYLLSLEALKMKGAITQLMSDTEMEDAIGKNVYSRAAQQVYWDGYWGQIVTVVDDFGQVKDNLANPNIEYDELVRISNTFPYALHMASLEQKASSFFTSALYIATTNLQNLNPPSLTEPKAVHRRINYAYNVTIKAEHREPGTTRVSKEIGMGPLRTDIYEFQLWDPATGLTAGPIMSFEDVRQDIRKELLRKKDQGKSDMATCVQYAKTLFQAPSTPVFVSPKDFVLPAEIAGQEEIIVKKLAGKTISYCLEFCSGRNLPHPMSYYYMKANHPEYPLDQHEEAFDQEEHLVNIRATNTWMQKIKGTFEKLWAMVNIKNVLAVISLCGLAYVGGRYASDTISYYRNKEADFPTKEGDNEMWQYGLYRAETGQDGGTFKYRQFLPEWYGDNQVYDTSAIPAEGILAGGGDDPIVPTKQWMMDQFGTDNGHEELMEEYLEFKAFKSIFESGKSRSQRMVRTNRRSANPRVRSRAQAWSNENAEQISETIARNSRTFQVGSRASHHCLMLKDRQFVINDHSWKIILLGARLENTKVLTVKFPGASVGTEVNIDDIEIRELTWAGQKIDLLMGKLPDRQFASARDITGFMVKYSEIDELKGKTAVLTVPTQAGLMQKQTSIIGPITTSASIEQLGSNITSIHTSIHMKGTTVSGDCGGFYITDSKDARRLFGMHSSGSPGSAYAAPMYQEMLNQVTFQSKFDEWKKEDEAILKTGGGNVEVIGRRPPVFANTKSKIVKTQIFEQVIPTTVAPAKMEKPLTPGGPALKGVEKQFGPVKQVDKEILNIAVFDYTDKLAETGVPDLKVLSFNDATRGIPGTDYFKPINRSRSAGYPWCLETQQKGKTKWFGNDDWVYNEHTYALEQKINDDIKEMIDGRIPEYIFVDTQKDETRPIEKVLAGKTRIFAAAPMDFIIVFRMYFLSFIVHMMRNRIANESAVGIRCQSTEWTDLYHLLKRKGKRVIAGDFSNYDGSLNPQILWAVYDVIESFHSRATPEDRAVRKALWTSIVNSKHLLGDILYQLNHSQPSGNPSTAVLNTMYNSLACRYVFFSIYELEPEDKFSDYVSMIAYGDDNVLNVSHQVPDFTQERMAEVFETIGMTYTDESKTGELRDKTIEEVAFLKRGFAWDVQLATCFCPLAKESILECFNWVKRSDNEGEIINQIATNAYVELALHPIEVYNEYALKIRLALEHYNILNIPRGYHHYRSAMAMGNLLNIFPGLEWA